MYLCIDKSIYLDMKIKVKPLELKDDDNDFLKKQKIKHIRKSIIFVVLGMIAGVGYYYFSEGQHLDAMTLGSITKSALVGGFFGFFITNSPCARGRC